MNTYVSVSRKDLHNNIRKIKSSVQSEIMAVVKCNGYGLGLELLTGAWYEEGIRFFGVSRPEEAFLIRKLGYKDCRVLLLTPQYDREVLQKLSEEDVMLTVTSFSHANTVAMNCPGARVHVKVNVGMGRFGHKYTDFEKIKSIYTVEGLKFEGIFAHFPMSFGKNLLDTRKQFAHFLDLTKDLKNSGIDYGIRHIANSCAALRIPETNLDLVRIGSAATGKLPCKVDLDLKPLGKLMAPVVDNSVLEQGDSTGYSMVYTANKYKKTSIIAAGYTDGWGVIRDIPALSFGDVLRKMLRILKAGVTKETVIYKDKKLKVLGRIGTQYTVVDRGNNEIKPGDFLGIRTNVMLVDSSIPRVLED